MRNHLFVFALVAAYMATAPTDTKRLAELHRLRDDAFAKDPPDSDIAEHISALVRAAEVAPVSADAKAAAERLAVFLTAPASTGETGSNTPAPAPQSPPASPAGEPATSGGDGQNAPQGDQAPPAAT